MPKKGSNPAEPAKPVVYIDPVLLGSPEATEAVEAARRRGWRVEAWTDIPPGDALLFSPRAHLFLPEMWDLLVPVLKSRAASKQGRGE